MYQAAAIPSISSSQCFVEDAGDDCRQRDLSAGENLLTDAPIISDVFSVGKKDRDLHQVIERHVGGMKLRDEI